MGKFLSLQDTADILGIHVRTVRRMIEKNELKAYKVARCVRVSEEDLREYLESNVIASAAAAKAERFTYRPGDRLV